jgi:hypothetical protein
MLTTRSLYALMGIIVVALVVIGFMWLLMIAEHALP